MSSPLIGPANLRPGSAGPVGVTGPATAEQTQQTEAPVVPEGIQANVPGLADDFGASGLAANAANLNSASAAETRPQSAAVQSLWGDSGMAPPAQSRNRAQDAQNVLLSLQQEYKAAQSGKGAQSAKANSAALTPRAPAAAARPAAVATTPAMGEIVTQANDGKLGIGNSGAKAEPRGRNDPLCHDLSDLEYELYGKMAEEDPSSAERFLLQTKLQKITELASFLSSLAKRRHDTAMSIIGNMR
ncbi:MAG: hypothetical protein ACT4TC_20610 [Myxococcaceae bacterium]